MKTNGEKQNMLEDLCKTRHYFETKTIMAIVNNQLNTKKY